MDWIAIIILNINELMDGTKERFFQEPTIIEFYYTNAIKFLKRYGTN